MLISYLAYFSVLKMEVIYSSKMPVDFHLITQVMSLGIELAKS
jgi:hypothetical protein